MPQFIRSLLEGHLDCFPFSIITNKDALDILTQLLWPDGFISLGCIPRDGIAGSHSRCVFNFLKELPNSFPKCFIHIAGGEFQLLLNLGTLDVRSTLCFHPLVIPAGVSNVTFPDDKWYGMSTFSYAYWLFTYILLWKVCSHLLPFFGCVVCFFITELQEFFIPDTCPLPDISVMNISSQSVFCLFSW